MILPVRSSAILTGSYVAGTVIGGPSSPINVGMRNQLNLLVGFTIGSLTSAQIKVEYSHDGTTYYQETFESISGTTATLVNGEYSIAATGNYVISIPIKASYIKISSKGTGTATSSLLVIDAVVGTV